MNSNSADEVLSLAAFRRTILRLLLSAGLKPRNADLVADIIVDGVLRGDSIEALYQLRSMVEQIYAGEANPGAEPALIKDKATCALIDGNNGPGQLAGVLAADIAMAKA